MQNNGARITFGGAAINESTGDAIGVGVGEFGLSNASGLRLTDISPGRCDHL